MENVEKKSLREYQAAAQAGKDSFGKTQFAGIPEMNGEFYVGVKHQPCSSSPKGILSSIEHRMIF